MSDYLLQTISASIIALYEVLGYPTKDVPNPLSLDKFDGHYDNHWKMLGKGIDGNKMTVYVQPYKLKQA
jgi:hypothetical protein